MSGSGDFLSRWSRRKRQAEAAKAAPPPEPGEREQPSPATAGATQTELSAEELAQLPPLDALTAETDLVQFLREGVPEWLRKAALRRIWALDPTVRDYAGDARDYAYDWNTPGGVPGAGPLGAGDAAESAIARISGGTVSPSPGSGDDASAETPGSKAPARSAGGGPEEPGDQKLVKRDEPEQIADAKSVLRSPVLPAPNSAESQPDHDDRRGSQPEAGEPQPPSRRHGGAMPV